MEIDDLFDARADGSVVISVHAQPGAGRTGIVGRHGAALKVKVAAPPEGGRANEALGRFLAETLGVKAAAVELTSGEASRQKRFTVTGIEVDDVRRLLDAALRESTPGRSRQS
jgi:uncharacterized protein (TIGR00251 family)